jgi:hypothetical protein
MIVEIPNRLARRLGYRRISLNHPLLVEEPYSPT